MKATQHGKERVRERQGLTEKSLDRMLPRILESVVKHPEASGRFKKYMDWLFLSHKNANNMRVYGGFVYLFNNETLITSFQLPSQYKAAADKISKRHKSGQ